MNCLIIILTAAAILLMPTAAFFQKMTTKSTACPFEKSIANPPLITICTHERGMVVLPQPQLFLRIFADGTAEYETGWNEHPGYAATRSVKKTLKLTEDEKTEIKGLVANAEVLGADADYPVFRQWVDSSMVTTLTIRRSTGSKTVILRNFSEGDGENKLHYPKPLIQLMETAILIRERGLGLVRKIPNISYCELMKNRYEYLNKKIEIYADLEYSYNVMANLKIVNEHEFLYDNNCDNPNLGPLRTIEKIGVKYIGDSTEIERLKTIAMQIRNEKFGNRGRMLLVGKLIDNRNAIGRFYDYTFAISDIKNLERIILPYKGDIKLGWTYSDAVSFEVNKPLTLSSPVKVPYHHAGRVEITNENQFPALKKSGMKYLVFKALSETILKVGNRWDSTFKCELLEVSDIR